jgi:hypothetical protein
MDLSNRLDRLDRERAAEVERMWWPWWRRLLKR